MLARSGFWPVLGLIKSSTLNTFTGGEGAFWKHIVRIFKNDIHIQLVYREERVPVTLSYIGTLADEAALKAVADFKGASGIKICMDPSMH